MELKRCAYCNKMPKVADVGGNNPFYEIACVNKNCQSRIVIGSNILQRAVVEWNRANTTVIKIGVVVS